MKRFLLPILATLAFPNVVNAEVPLETHYRCIKANKLENFSKTRTKESFFIKTLFTLPDHAVMKQRNEGDADAAGKDDGTESIKLSKNKGKDKGKQSKEKEEHPHGDDAHWEHWEFHEEPRGEQIVARLFK